MTTIAETFKAEVYARLLGTTLDDYGPNAPQASNVRRYHLTNVDREDCPAIHMRAGDATKDSEDKGCRWCWSLEVRVSVYVRSDAGDGIADPIVNEVVRRLNPNVTPRYSNGVDLRLTKIETDTEVADTDAQRVDVVLTAKYDTGPWTLDARGT